MKALLNLRFPRKQALGTALLFALLLQHIAPLTALADGPAVGEAYSFTSVGNLSWTVPAGVGSIKAKVWGGGGAGGNGEKIDNSHRSGLGGGAGGYAEKTIAVAPGDSFSITVGAGGQGIQSVENGRIGNPGSESRFEGNVHALVASGGTGGASYAGGGNPVEPVGFGGAASGGDLNQSGADSAGYSVDSDGNPVSTSGGSAANGGTGGTKGRCGRDGQCPGSDPGSPWAQDGAAPGGGGGGSDVGQGGFGGQGQVVIEVVSLATPLNPITATLTTTAGSCVVSGTAIPFTATVSGSGVTSVVLEKDTNGDNQWGQDTNAPLQTTSWTAPGTYTFNSNESASYTGTYALRLVVNGEVKDTKSITVAANCDGTTIPTTPITATLTTTAPSCVAAGTSIPFTAVVSGSGVTSVVVEKDTNSDNQWGQDTNTPLQTTSWTAPGTYTFNSNEASSYTGTYRLRLLVNGEVKDTKSVTVAADCGGSTQPPVTASLTTSSPSCVALGTDIVFSANVSGAGVTSVVLEKDTNGDNQWGQDTNTPLQTTSWNAPGIYSFTSNEASNYAGTYRLRLLVNGEVKDTKSVTIAADCGGGTTTPTPITATLTTTAPSCVAAGTSIPFTAVVSGSGVTSVVLEKDTNGDNQWGQDTNAPIQATSWSAPGTYTFNSNESASYTGTYSLRLVVNGTVRETRSVTVATNCGGGTTTPTPITATLTTTAGSCVVSGTAIPFTATVSGSGVTSVVLEKDTNGDNQWGQDTNAPLQTTSWTAPGTYTFNSNESASYTGTYALRLVVNGTVRETRSVSVAANCGGGSGGTSSGGGGTPTTPPATGTGGGGEGSRSGGRSRTICTGFNCPTASTGTLPGDILILIDTPPAASGGRITGPEQVCPAGNLINTFLRIGIDNNPSEVTKLQEFLNRYEGAGLAVTGDFDTATENAVKALQAKYTDEILAPWGVTEPTGIVYLTTTRFINNVYCGNTDIKDNNTDVLEPVNPDDFDGAIGQATSTPGINANIAGIFGALKDVPWYQLLILMLLLIGGAFIISTSFRKDMPTDEAYMSLIRGAAVLVVGTVLNVLNTVSYILNPQWFVEKTGVTLPWLLGLNAVNLGAITLICLAVLISLYERIARMKN